jgi:indole-3-glycerol phosphate synthase
MSSFLKNMAQSSAARVAALKTSFSSDDLDRTAYPLHLNGFDIIAEIKNRSPAEGELASIDSNRADRARRYASGGAAAISVLTEPDRFDGHLNHLKEVVAAVAEHELPVMRKDFLVDTVQVLEAKAAGASGILLIAAILSDDELDNMLDCAFDNDLFVLLESFDETDIERSAFIMQKAKIREQAARNKFLVGVNSRNLQTLALDPLRIKRFGPLLPGGVTCVAESGQHTAEDAADVAAWGYEMALVGTALMRADDPTALIGEMLVSGRGVVSV